MVGEPFLWLMKRCEEAEGSSPIFFQISGPEKFSLQGANFSTVEKILSLHQHFSCKIKTKIK